MKKNIRLYFPILLLLFLLVSTPGHSQFGIPDIGDILDDIPGLEDIPGLGFNLGQDDERPLTTSFDAAVTGIPFLDSYNPEEYISLRETVFGPRGGWVLVPGSYQVNLRTYCLRAGTRGPSRGEGYLYAPLTGQRAEVIGNIMRRSAYHLEIPQRDVQLLLWGVLSRTKVSDMYGETRNAARILLTPDEFADLDSDPLDLIPPDMMNQVFESLGISDEIRSVMEAEANIRSMLTSPGATFEEIEALAVLTGEPLFEEEGPLVPDRRWSYHPDGYFIRYHPLRYSETVVEVSSPDFMEVVRDAQDRITTIGDSRGNMLEIEYSNGSSDRIDSITYTRLDRIRPWETNEEVWTDIGNPADYASGSWTNDLRNQIEKINANPDNLDVLIELGMLAKALERSGVSTSAWNLVMETWQDEFLDQMYIQNRVALRNKRNNDGQSLIASAGYKGGYGWFGPSRPIPEYVPGGTGAPANNGSQFIGNSPVPTDVDLSQYIMNDDDDDEEEETEENPKPSQPSEYGSTGEALDRFESGVLNVQAGSTMALSQAPVADFIGPFAVPMALASQGLRYVVDVYNKVNNILGGDPPRSDFTETSSPEFIPFPMIQPSDDVPVARADAFNELGVACFDLLAWMRATVITLDRHGGALQAGNEEWIYNQAALLAQQKRNAGEAMLLVADKIYTYYGELRSEGIEDIFVTREAIEEYHNQLRTSGFSSDELEAARLIGITDSELETMRRDILATDPAAGAGSMMDAMENLADAFIDHGIMWMNLSNPPSR